MDVTLRPASADDDAALADLHRRNRAHFATGGPRRDDAWYSPQGQAEVIRRALESERAGTGLLRLVEHEGTLVGEARLSSIIRGAFQSASVGYLVDAAHTGRGVATSALRGLVTLAFDELRLHRLQARP